MSAATAGDNHLPMLAAEIRAAHDACGRSTGEALGHAIEAGRRLTEAKRLVRHGGWEDWLRANVPAISVRAAQRYMRAAGRAGKNDALTLFTLRALVDPLWERWGYLGPHHVLVLTPSYRLGFTHLTVFETGTWMASGFAGPVADDRLKNMVHLLCARPWPRIWDRKRSRPHRDNPHLQGATPEYETNPEFQRQLDRVLEAYERKLAELQESRP